MAQVEDITEDVRERQKQDTFQSTLPPEVWQAPQMRAHNEEVQSRDFCIVCAVAVDDEDHEWKFAGAGGVIVGPFCSRECHWMWINDPEEAEYDHA